jgi:type I restriction enzyme M protein
VVSACNGSSLKAEFENQLKEEAELNERILDNLAKVKVDG